MAYTNGFDNDKVMDALFGRVGWKGENLNSKNTCHKSGRYFNDGSFHALVTLSNIKSVIEEVNPSGEVLDNYLEQLQKSIILRSLNGLFNEPQYISQGLLYNRWGGNDIPIENNNRFCGVWLKVPPTSDIAVQVDSVALYFDQDVTFTLFLYNDLIKEPIWSSEVIAKAWEQVIVKIPADKRVIKHVSGSNQGGIFYLGYYQEQLGSVRAINEAEACLTGNQPYGYQYIETTVVGDGFNRKTYSNSSQTYGLNPHISVFRDYTEKIVRHASLFDNLIGLQMAAQVIEQVLFTTRSNGTERALKGIDLVATSLDLNGVAPISDSPQTTGLKKQITQELVKLKKTFFPSPKAQTVSLC